MNNLLLVDQRGTNTAQNFSRASKNQPKGEQCMASFRPTSKRKPSCILYSIPGKEIWMDGWMMEFKLSRWPNRTLIKVKLESEKCAEKDVLTKKR